MHPYPNSPRTTAGYQCVEFSERYMYYQYGLAQPNVYTDGDQVVDVYNRAYPGAFTVYSQGPGNVPVQGDVLSLSSVSSYSASNGGHTAVVQSSSVNSSGAGSVTVVEENGAASGTTTYQVKNWKFVTSYAYVKWLHRPTNPVAQYAGHIVQWNGDTKSQKTSWYVTPDLRRLWIPDVTTYNCLKSHGAPGPDVLAAKSLNGLPDQSGHWAACGDQIWAGREMRQGMSLKSADGRFTFVLQTDGNLVLYDRYSRPLWASGHGADFVVMQSDGNFVGYLNSGLATWATNTGGSGATHLVVQSDGNLVLYTSANRAVWSSGTAWSGEQGHIVQWSGDTKSQKTAWYVTPDYKREWIPDIGTYNCLKGQGVAGPDVLPAGTLNQLPDQNNQWVPCGDTMAINRTLRRNMALHSADGRYTLILQGDGNLVLYGPSGRALWANSRSTTDFVVMQGDGNLVGYTNGGNATWASNTTSSGGNRLVVQNDGNVVIYSATRAVWATNTAGQS